jgi:plastocyanin
MELLGTRAARGTVGRMHPTGVASAALVFAAAPSKVPFYIAGGLLAAWAVALAAVGITHPEFPGSEGRARLVMGATAALVVTTMAMGVVTAGKETTAEAGPAPAPPAGAGAHALKLAAVPSGQLAFDRKQATVAAGKVAIDFTNSSPVPHNVTIERGGKAVTATRTIQSGTASTTATLPAGSYVFYCSVDAHRQGGMQGTLTVR